MAQIYLSRFMLPTRPQNGDHRFQFRVLRLSFLPQTFVLSVSFVVNFTRTPL
ncbi:MAG: hypothetical protein JWM16_3839 [Verrucomicrobiales bacterium]|nr:hypothetical protein [Verrucomicrobiales bacterium]